MKEYTKAEKIALIIAKHEKASAEYLRTKDFKAYQEQERAIKRKLEQHGISQDEYWKAVIDWPIKS